MTWEEIIVEDMKRPPSKTEIENAKHIADLIDAEILEMILGKAE